MCQRPRVVVQTPDPNPGSHGSRVLPVHDHAVWDEDAVQISGVVGWVGEEVQAVAGPVIPELGGTNTIGQCYTALLCPLSQTLRIESLRKEKKSGLHGRARSRLNAQLQLVQQRTRTFFSRHCTLFSFFLISTQLFTTIPPLLPSDWTGTSSIL